LKKYYIQGHDLKVKFINFNVNICLGCFINKDLSKEIINNIKNIKDMDKIHELEHTFLYYFIFNKFILNNGY